MNNSTKGTLCVWKQIKTLVAKLLDQLRVAVYPLVYTHLCHPRDPITLSDDDWGV